MKRGYLWVDWVELGCRGWEIDPSGAGLATDAYYAHLDRTTLDLIVGGSPQWHARVYDDLEAAGLFVRESSTSVEWELTQTLGTATEHPTSFTGNTVVTDVQWRGTPMLKYRTKGKRKAA